MTIDKVLDLIETTPNDQELGKAIRELYWASMSE